MTLNDNDDKTELLIHKKYNKRNKTRSEVITLLNWRQFRRDKLPLFMSDNSVLTWHE